jgi:uncharacterized membrane protein
MRSLREPIAFRRQRQSLQTDRDAHRGLPPLTTARLANLSDTMFGVAMTLLATTLVPHTEQLTGSALEMLRSLREPLSAVLLSFAISAIYWISQQRRLSMTELLTPRQTVLHLVFLFMIVLLPISTGLFARLGSTAASVAIFGSHITLLSAINLALWIEVHRRVDAWFAVIPSTSALVLLGSALAIGLIRPELPQYLWYTALAIPLVTRFVHRAVLRIGDPD